MKKYLYLIYLLWLAPLCGYGQQASLYGRVNLDTGWVRKFYLSRMPRFDDMFTASRALIIAEGNIDTGGNFTVTFPSGADESLYRLHFIRKGDPASTLLIGSMDVNHVFFIAKKGSRINFTKQQSQPILQANISGSGANSELNAVLIASGNDRTDNDALLAFAAHSTSQLVCLLAISRTDRLNKQQTEKVQNILDRYQQHNVYGNLIFQQYGYKNYVPWYLGAGTLLAIGLSFYGYRFYKKHATYKIWRELTQREMDIAKLIQLGKSNKEVALALNIELSTVKTHVNNIYTKLKITGRKELDRYKDLVKK